MDEKSQKKAPVKKQAPKVEEKPAPAPEPKAEPAPAEKRNLTQERLADRYGSERAKEMVK